MAVVVPRVWVSLGKFGLPTGTEMFAVNFLGVGRVGGRSGVGRSACVITALSLL